jgi:hypothetical protein
MKPEDTQFLLFLGILLRYLQSKDGDDDDQHTPTYQKLRLALYDCATKSRRQERGYESLTHAVKRIIFQLVSKEDLIKARNIFRQCIVQQKQQLILRHSTIQRSKK